MIIKFGKMVKCFCFIVLCLLAVGTTIAQSTKSKDKTIRIDTHIHIYDTNREGSSTFLDPVNNKKIYFPHLSPEFLEVASPAGVNYAVVVEASKRRVDNEWAMSVVNKSPSLLAFIGNLDPRDPDYINDLDLLCKHNKFRGIRIRPLRKIDISDENIIEKLGELEKRNLVLELGPKQNPIEAIEKIANRYPKMNIIINHMAGGRIQNGEIQPGNWNKRLSRLAAFPNIYCKISALYALSGQSPAPINVEFYTLFINQVIDNFGAERVLYGSNWTLSEMNGSYADLVGIYDKYLQGRKDITTEQLFLKNAVKAYGLDITVLMNK
jgi:predicted TIM-barrel fold metal-dependent hydrolase